MISMKKAIVCLLSTQLLLASAVYASDMDQSEETRARRIGPCGRVLRGYGPNIAEAPVLTACAVCLDKGKQVGVVRTSRTENEGAFLHEFDLGKCGQLSVEIINTLVFTSPVNAAVVGDFPELAPYLNNPDAIIRVFVSTHTKENDPAVISWTGSGMFKKDNYIEFRCVFLAINGVTTQCLGCHWFIGRQ